MCGATAYAVPSGRVLTFSNSCKLHRPAAAWAGRGRRGEGGKVVTYSARAAALVAAVVCCDGGCVSFMHEVPAWPHAAV